MVEVPTPVLFTSILTGMRRVSWSIWLITPMVLPDNRRLSSAFKAASRVSLSSVPKPSSKNNDSSLERPLLRSEKCQCQPQADQERLAAGQGFDRALFACVPQVYYHHVLQVKSPKGVSEYH